MITPSVPTYDDLTSTTYDNLYTYDDPLRDQRISDAMNYGTVTRDGPSAAISWTEAGDVVDGLSVPFARDHFDRPAFVRQTLNSNPYFETTASPWSGINGCTVARDTTLFHEGVASLQATPNGVGTNPIAQAEEVAVIAGREYFFAAWMRIAPAGTNGRDFGISWYDAAHVFISNGFLSFGVGSGVWTYCAGSAVAPLGTAYGVLTCRGNGVLAAADTWRLDEAIMSGSPATAASGGTTNLPVPGLVWSGSTTGISQDGDYLVFNPMVLNSLYVMRLGTIEPSIDFDVAIKVRARQLFTGAKGSAYLVARSVDNLNYLRFRVDFNTDGIMGWGAEQVVAGSASTVISGLSTMPVHNINTWVWLRVQGAGASCRLKVWTDGQFQSDDWTITFQDTVFFGTPGIVGVGAALVAGNTNALPYQSFQFAEFFSGVNAAVDVNRISTSMSLDDGYPQGASDTSSSGVADMTADLGSPVGTQDRVYWSTFRADQPYGDIPRDIAGVGVSSGLVTADGIRTARLFTGQMADTPVNGRQVQLKGISRNRLRMTEPIQPPAINGPYEGCEGTWPVSYALFKSRVYVAPPPLPGCRMYIPFHGSTHPMIPSTNGLSWPYGVNKYSTPSTSQWARPTFVDGPFLSGLYCSMKPGDTRTWQTNVDTAVFESGDDFWSQRSAKGRIEFWVRGDPTDLFGSENSTETIMGLVQLTQNDQGRYVMVGIGCPDRRPYFQVKDGVNTAIIKADPIPSDGQWHFIGASWNLSVSGQNFRLVRDTQLVTSNFGSMANANLPATDTVDRLRVRSYLPISELRITSGAFGPNAQASWVKDLPFNPQAIMRRSDVQLEGLAETDMTEAYSYVNAFAQADLAQTGYNEFDQFVYLPPRYWAEPEQQVEIEVFSPDTNLDPDFTPQRAVNRVYNKITVQFKSSTVQQGMTKVYESSETMIIRAHDTVTVVLPTVAPVIQLRDYAWAVRDGATHTGLGIDPYNYVNYVTANTAQDGTGTYASLATLIINVISWDPGSITIQMSNLSNTDFYLANNVNLPVIGMGGKILQVNDDSVVAENTYSVVQRNVRTLPVNAPVLQSRDDALSLARELASRLGQPRIQFTAKVFANPTRTPGRLVRVQDLDATGINTPFRILSVTTAQEGHKIDQTVTAQDSLPVLVWGVGNWGQAIWGVPT